MHNIRFKTPIRYQNKGIYLTKLFGKKADYNSGFFHKVKHKLVMNILWRPGLGLKEKSRYTSLMPVIIKKGKKILI